VQTIGQTLGKPLAHAVREGSFVAVRIGRNGVIGALALALVALLGWAWYDGGEQPLRAMTAPTSLPTVVR
jgi:hypothetical protein